MVSSCLSRLGRRLERRDRAAKDEGPRHGEGGPCDHCRTEWSIGHQDAMIPMAMSARGGNEHGHPVEPLEGGEIEHNLSIGPGFHSIAGWSAARPTRWWSRLRLPRAA